MKARSMWATSIALVLAGCSGSGTGGQEKTGGSAPGAATDQPLALLTAAEYADSVGVLLDVAPSAQTVPLTADSTGTGFATNTPSADEIAQAFHASAIQIAGTVTSSARLSALLHDAGCAAPSGNSGTAGAACAAAFITEFAPLAFRQTTVDAPTLAGLNGVYAAVAVTRGAGFSGGIAAVLEEILQSPYFLYKGLPA